MTPLFRWFGLGFICSAFLVSFISSVFAESDIDKQFLLMYFKEEELVVEAPTRGKKAITQVAENITVITANEIKQMNAHTVAEVLNTVTGVQVFITGGPGSMASAGIQGSDSARVSVFIDGIPINELASNTADIGSLSVQNIDKIEIIKGPASSAWGSALGGVINIITKSGKEHIGAAIFATSYGQKNTGDFRIETTGKEDRVGFYVSAGRLQTDGFRPHNEFSGNNAFAKLSYDITHDTTITASVGFDTLERGVYEIPAYDLFGNNDVKSTRSSLSLRSVLNSSSELNLLIWQINRESKYYTYMLGSKISQDRYHDKGYGSSAKIAWSNGLHKVIVGADFDSRGQESNTIADGKKSITKHAYYINDTMTFGDLSVIPGARYDKTDTNGDFTSPSIGATYKMQDMLLRAYVAKGFNIPELGATYGDNLLHISNPDLKMEKVKSYQVGMESAAIKYLWLKLDIFRNDVEDRLSLVTAPSGTQSVTINQGRERLEGFDIELKTAPVHYLSLRGGASFIRAENRDTGQKIENVPQKTFDAGMQYNDGLLNSLIIAHYIYWNSAEVVEGKYDKFVVDFHVSRKMVVSEQQELQLFVDIHNIFDAEQYPVSLYKNPERWFEAGLRYAF